jgi:hypothetical protein
MGITNGMLQRPDNFKLGSASPHFHKSALLSIMGLTKQRWFWMQHFKIKTNGHCFCKAATEPPGVRAGL